MAKDMKVKDYVAQIGETKYKTLSEAIENVNGDNNQTKIKKLIHIKVSVRCLYGYAK